MPKAKAKSVSESKFEDLKWEPPVYSRWDRWCIFYGYHLRKPLRYLAAVLVAGYVGYYATYRANLDSSLAFEAHQDKVRADRAAAFRKWEESHPLRLPNPNAEEPNDDGITHPI